MSFGSVHAQKPTNPGSVCMKKIMCLRYFDGIVATFKFVQLYTGIYLAISKILIQVKKRKFVATVKKSARNKYNCNVWSEIIVKLEYYCHAKYAGGIGCLINFHLTEGTFVLQK